MNTYLKGGISGDFHFLIEQTHKVESRADDLRDATNELMYSRALIPESREDIMALLEKVDEISDQADRVSKRINIMTMKKRV